MLSSFISVLTAFLLLSYAFAWNAFNLADCYAGAQFFDGFEWNTFNDPTHGRVNYVSKSQAIQMNLSYASHDAFTMRADNQSHLNSITPRGRNSVRITSLKAYGDSIIVLDLQHMPEGCATWPAFWTKSAKGPWPNGGEIDIIEGVNRQATNQATLHTSPNCTMPNSNVGMLGKSVSNNCDASVDFNKGCGVTFPQQTSYGAGLNNVGGGWYVMKRTVADGVWVWFWARNDINVPIEIEYNLPTLTPDFSWGEPTARFVPDQCDMATHFDAHHIVFDLTFCGDWAGSVFSTAGCGSQSCSDFVDNNPSAFDDAYWVVNSLRIYTPFDWS